MDRGYEEWFHINIFAYSSICKCTDKGNVHKAFKSYNRHKNDTINYYLIMYLMLVIWGGFDDANIK